MYEYKATVARVVDGDTVDITIDLGFRITTKQRVRMQGINAPEHNTAEGQAALAYLATRLPNGSTVMVQSNKPGEGDKYGRYLARLWAGTVDINAEMIAMGYAKPWDGSGTKPV